MSKIIGSVKWVAFETILAKALGLSMTLYVARLLGPQAMGTIALILIAIEVFNLFSQLGITQALIHYKNPSREQLATLYTVNWLFAVLSYVAILFASPFLANFFNNSMLAELLPVAGLSLLVSAAGQQTLTLLQKELMFKATAFIALAGVLTNFAVTITLVNNGWGIWSIVIGQVSGIFTRNVSAIFYAFNRGLFSGFGISFRTIKPLISFGLYQTGAMSMNMINSRVDQAIIGKTIGESALGIYSVGSQITLQTMQQINSIATRVTFPAISKEQGNLIVVKEIYLNMVANVLLVSAPIFLGLSALSSIFVDVVLGSKWVGLSTVLSILCGYVLIRSLGNMNGPLVMGLGKANWAFYWNLGLLVLIPTVVFLTSLYGDIELVATSLLATQLVLIFVAYFYWVRRLIGPCLHEYVSTITRPISAATLMALLLYFVQHYYSFENDLLSLTILVLLGSFTYLFFSFFINKSNTLGFIRYLINKV